MLDLQQRLERLLFDHARAHPVAPWSPVLKLLRYPYALIRDFLTGELNLRAMSLVYTSLLSVVPLLAFGFAIFKGLDIHHNWEPLIHEFFRPTGENADRLTAQVMAFVENTRGDVLGSLGLAFLIYTVVSAIQKLEESMNFVWRVERPRSFARRISEYLTLMVLGPIVIVTLISLTASMGSTEIVHWLLGFRPFGWLLISIQTVAPYVVVSLLFTFFYRFIPNTRVRILPALAGGFFAGLLWMLAGAVFTAFVVYSSRLQLVYTSFAFIVTALIWIYVAWLILLLGAQLSFYAQNPQYLRRGQQPIRLTASLAEALAINAMYLIGKSFKLGEPSWTTNRLASRLDVPSAMIAPVIRSLEGAGLLVATEDERLMPGRDLSDIALNKIVDAARRYHPGEPMAHVHNTPAAEEVIAAVDQALHERLAGMTLRDLLERGSEPL